MYEDTYRIRQFNEMKIRHEFNSIDMLKKCLKESEEHTNKMTNILNNFETRLSALHDLIVPVYDSTNTLQIKYSNLQKTVSKLDNIIEYYDSVKNLSHDIQAGPGKDIKAYLVQLSKLKAAIQYFNDNNNKSQKKDNEELWMKGRSNVDREFEILLGKFSDINLTVDLDSEKDNLDESRLFASKENDLKQMIGILDWFKETEPTYLDKLYEKIIKFRSKLILENLQRIREKGNSLSNGNSMSLGGNLSSLNNGSTLNSSNKRGSLTPLSPGSANLNSSFQDERKSTFRSRLGENLFNSTSDLKKKALKSGANLNESYSGSAAGLNKTQNLFLIDLEVEIGDCIKFSQCFRKALSMFKVDNKLIFKLIDSKDKIIPSKILERIFDPVLRYLKEEADRLSNNVKLIDKKCTSKYITSMFSILSDMVEMKSSFLKIFEQSTLITKTTRHISNSTQIYLEIFVNIEKACAQSLRDIADEVKNDPLTTQPNGNIHPITTETITFIENLLPFDVIAGFISSVVISENTNQMVPSEVEMNLRREASKANSAVFNRVAYQVETNNEKKIYRIALAEYFDKLFRRLNLNLKNKAQSYEDETLRCIFLLNNFYKISKLFTDMKNQTIKQDEIVKPKNLSELFILTNKNELKSNYDSEILKLNKDYPKCWNKLLNFIKDLNESNPFTSTDKLKDKDRQLLKDRFSGFNKEFDEIYETQKRYYIPSEQADLAKMIRENNIVYVITQYKKFYDTYSKINFATNREKYIKYQPEHLAAKIREFFTAY